MPTDLAGREHVDAEQQRRDRRRTPRRGRSGRPACPAGWPARGTRRWCRRTAAGSTSPRRRRCSAVPGRGSRRRRSPGRAARPRSTAGGARGWPGRESRSAIRRLRSSLAFVGTGWAATVTSSAAMTGSLARRSGTATASTTRPSTANAARTRTPSGYPPSPNGHGREHGEGDQRPDQRAEGVHRPVHAEVAAQVGGIGGGGDQRVPRAGAQSLAEPVGRDHRGDGAEAGREQHARPGTAPRRSSRRRPPTWAGGSSRPTSRRAIRTSAPRRPGRCRRRSRTPADPCPSTAVM